MDEEEMMKVTIAMGSMGSKMADGRRDVATQHACNASLLVFSHEKRARKGMLGDTKRVRRGGGVGGRGTEYGLARSEVLLEEYRFVGFNKTNSSSLKRGWRIFPLGKEV
ncbi:hypothetical protein V1477_003959 [Vespula maculifrons]|uniref:Uncharacterized protein n=2 Tax=Vespula TaxID=7451 RepID=A0A834NNK6_VESGE|nr:hypothetical protein HZH68_003138 [Vespula germanica]